jgi:hypothetical protein
MDFSTLPRSLRPTARTVLLAALVLLLVPAPRAHAVTDPVIADWHYSTTSVSVSGLASVPVTITVHVTGGTGSVEGMIAWSRTSNRYARNPIGVALRLVSGGAGDAVYAGTYAFTSAYPGTFSLQLLGAPEGVPALPIYAPAGTPLVVTATHVPRVTLGAAPSPVALTVPFVVKGRVYDTATRLGIAGVTVTLSTICGGYCGLATARTNALGYYAFPYRTDYFGSAFPADPHRMYVVVTVRGAQQSDGTRYPIATASLPYVAILVSPRASAVKAWRPVGAWLTIVGNVRGWPFSPPYPRTDYPAPSCQVALERRTATTSWTKVTTARVRESGRFTLTLRANARGSYLFRVYVPRCASVVPVRSHVVHVTVG